MAADVSKSDIHLIEDLFHESQDGAVTIPADVTFTGNVTLPATQDLVFDDLSITGPLELGVDNAERASIKGIVHIAALSVTIPTIADAEADLVEVTVGAAATLEVAAGDVVIASPASLPTDCIFTGAYVSGADKITFTFDTKEGGTGVTGAAHDFSVLIFDLT